MRVLVLLENNLRTPFRYRLGKHLVTFPEGVALISREACPHSPKGRLSFRATARGALEELGQWLA